MVLNLTILINIFQHAKMSLERSIIIYLYERKKKMFYYLNHWQVLTLIHAIEEIKKNNPYFQDTVSDEFVKNCFEEATRI